MRVAQRNIVLFGCPGAGKGAQAALISALGGWPHVSTGALLRAEIARGTALGRRLEARLAGGGFADDATILEIVRVLIDRPRFGSGFVMDGFPRTVVQAESFDKLLARRGRAISHAIHIRAREDVIFARLGGRRVCLRCGATYHVEFRPSRAGARCEDCGTRLARRADDAPSAQVERLRIHARWSAPVLAHYRRSGVLSEVDGETTIAGVARQIRAILAATSLRSIARESGSAQAGNARRPEEDSSRRAFFRADRRGNCWFA